MMGTVYIYISPEQTYDGTHVVVVMVNLFVNLTGPRVL